MNELSNTTPELLGIEHPIVHERMGPYRTERIAVDVSTADVLGRARKPGSIKDAAEGTRLHREHIDNVVVCTERSLVANVPVGELGNDIAPGSVSVRQRPRQRVDGRAPGRKWYPRAHRRFRRQIRRSTAQSAQAPKW